TLSQAGLRAAIWVSAVAMRLGEDSERGKATKGRISTRRLTAIRAALLQAPQLGLQFRRRREQAVGDLGDFLCLPPLPFQPRDLRLLVHRHLQGEPSIGRRSRGWNGNGGRQRKSPRDRKSTRLNSSHGSSSDAVFCLKK